MASTIEEIEAAINESISTGYRGRLLERGLARSMIWVDGSLPDDAPHFSNELSYDLLSYGYSLLSLAIRLRELDGNVDLCRTAFEKAGSAITDVLQNGEPDNPERGFHNVLAASAYHLGRFSAKAFSLLQSNRQSENVSLIEIALSSLMLRDFDALENTVLQWKVEGSAADEVLAEKIEVDIVNYIQIVNAEDGYDTTGFESVELPVVDLAITDNYFSSIFEFLFALETGNQEYLENAVSRIDISLSVCGELNLLPQWWIHRITKHLLEDLWESSFHKVIPTTPNDDHHIEWLNLRWMFISSLYKRNKAEIDLWPSQLEGAHRAVNDLDDLVVSLPTSAGKTRVAELCILRCLAIGKRVLFITPLRALSAQTESTLRKTFLPLGKSVTSLYGSIGTSDFEQDVLRTKDIVVGTPEKLDFALRNDPSLIDDVGLVVLDEGHMIGLSEREINYEVQIQRLLKRADADERRIVCLSAILPDGDQLEDFVGWLRRDKEGGAIQSEWRPTDLRFGEIIWNVDTDTARLNFTIGDEQPFIPDFIQSFVPPLPNPGLRKKSFPNDAQELTLAAAWRLVQDNHTVLIYCPLKISVNAMAKTIVDLHARGALDCILTAEEDSLELAKILGREWLGEGHPIVACLDIGVAVHHGGLPTPFRKEMEKLLREGVLKVTVSSPTLAQGLNLTATAVIFYSLIRNREVIKSSEFKNVIGRAGRAFIDTHGLVLYPIFDDHRSRLSKWRKLVGDANAKNMESGLVRLVLSLVLRMAKVLKTNATENILEYVINNVDTWSFPEVERESQRAAEDQRNKWTSHIINLDTALLSLLGSEEVPINDIPEALDIILQSSLWQRRLNRHNEDIRTLFNSVISQRGKYIWSVTTALQRKGYFLAGVGLETGQRLDAVAQQANILLVNANSYIDEDEQEAAINTITELAELLFSIPPFTPRVYPEDWKNILSTWLNGEVLTEVGFNDIDDALKFVEDGLIYRLPWGMEAVKVRAQANQDEFMDGVAIDDFELGLVVPAVENGSLNRSAAMLMQAGFNSRKAAIHAVVSTEASFTNGRGLNAWLESELVSQLTNSLTWPTQETSKLWQTFVKEYKPTSETIWENSDEVIPVTWFRSYTPQMGTIVKLWNSDEWFTKVVSSKGEQIGVLPARYNLLKNGVYTTVVAEDNSFLHTSYWGVGNAPFERAIE